MYKIEKDLIVYYYGSHKAYIMALEGKDTWTKSTLACAVINTRNNTVIKCRYDIEEIFNAHFADLYYKENSQLELEI